MRQHDLSFANFVLRFGIEEVMLDYAQEIVLPAFLGDRVRKYGDTTFRFYNVKFTQVGEENETPILALSGHLVKDTVLRRQQIFRAREGLIEDAREMESAPSSFFVLMLNNHRLLYFAETAAAPDLQAFAVTAQSFLREEWQTHVRNQHERLNVTRRGVERLTLRQVRGRYPPPYLNVVPVADQDAIQETIRRFGKIRQIRVKLVQPNDELDASAAVSAVEKAFRPLAPSRLEVVASAPEGLDKDEAAKAITGTSEGHNTQIVVDGEDKAGIRMQADNEKFALSLPIDEPPEDDQELKLRLLQAYEHLVGAGKVRRLPTPANVIEKLKRLIGLL